MSRFVQPFLFRICMVCAYTRPRYQVSVYRTIGPLQDVKKNIIRSVSSNFGDAREHGDPTVNRDY